MSFISPTQARRCFLYRLLFALPLISGPSSRCTEVRGAQSSINSNPDINSCPRLCPQSLRICFIIRLSLSGEHATRRKEKLRSASDASCHLLGLDCTHMNEWTNHQTGVKPPSSNFCYLHRYFSAAVFGDVWSPVFVFRPQIPTTREREEGPVAPGRQVTAPSVSLINLRCQHVLSFITRHSKLLFAIALYPESSAALRETCMSSCFISCLFLHIFLEKFISNSLESVCVSISISDLFRFADFFTLPTKIWTC